MKKDSITSPIRSIERIFKRFSIVLFIVIVVGELIFSIFVLNRILAKLPNTISTSIDQNITEILPIDQTTIDQYNNLKLSNNNIGDQGLPAGRINPFFE